MKYSRFEELPVWRAAMRFSLGVFELVKDRTFVGEGDLRDQLQRSSLSISLNVAEGFERGTTNELLYFLYVARGSAGEARSGLRFCEQYPPMTHLRTRVRELIAQGEGISRQLRGWADALQNSDIAGQRHLNEQTRAEFERRVRTDEFVKKLERIRREGTGAMRQEDAGSGGPDLRSQI